MSLTFPACNLPRSLHGRLVGLAALVAGALAWGQSAPSGGRPDPARFENDIRAFEEWDRKNAFPTDGVLFVGSSSIRMWPTHEAFSRWPVINRGFGGSHLSDVVHFVPRVVLPYHPRVIVLYAGDNDIAAGLKPEDVLADFRAFVAAVRAKLRQTPIVYLAIKPSPSRSHYWDAMQQANSAIRAQCEPDPRLKFVDTATPLLGSDRQPRAEYYLEDKLHLSPAGYALWREVVESAVERLLKEQA